MAARSRLGTDRPERPVRIRIPQGCLIRTPPGPPARRDAVGPSTAESEEDAFALGGESSPMCRVGMCSGPMSAHRQSRNAGAKGWTPRPRLRLRGPVTQAIVSHAAQASLRAAKLWSRAGARCQRWAGPFPRLAPRTGRAASTASGSPRAPVVMCFDHWCSLAWISSTRRRASSRLGHGASVFTGDLLAFQLLAAGLLGPFAM